MTVARSKLVRPWKNKLNGIGEFHIGGVPMIWITLGIVIILGGLGLWGQLSKVKWLEEKSNKSRTS